MNNSSLKINSNIFFKYAILKSSNNFIKKRKNQILVIKLIIKCVIIIFLLLIIIISFFIIFKNIDYNSKKKINYYNFDIEQQLNLSKEIIKIYSTLLNAAKNELTKPQNLTNYSPKNIAYKKKKGIGICCIGKNENLYAKEYVDYYLKLGIKRIIIYDNNDINGEKFEDVLEIYIKNNFVEIINIRGFHSAQIPIYNICYKTYKNKFDYISFLDFDEFITIENNININEYIYNSKMNNCETILLNWINYGDNDLEKYDNRTMIERFIKPTNTLNRGKSIVRTDISNLIIFTSHIIGINTNYFCDSNGKRLFPQNFYDFSPPKKADVFIKHFFSKTAEEFCIKLKRGDAHFHKDQSDYIAIMNGRIETFMRYNKINNEKINILEKCSGINLNNYRYKKNEK